MKHFDCCKVSRVLVVVCCVFLVFLAPPAVAQQPSLSFASEKFGYSFPLPEAWAQIPPTVLDEFIKLMINPDAKFQFEAAYQASYEGQWMSYPYLISQVTPYAELGSIEPPTVSQMKALLKLIAGLNTETIVEGGLKDDFQSLLSDADLSEPVFNRDDLSYVFDVTLDVAFVGKVKGRSVGYFTKTGIVQINFYDTVEHWDDSAKDRTAILSSITISPDFILDAKEGSGWDMMTSRILGSPFFAAIFGGMIAFIVGYFLKRKNNNAA